MLEKHKIITDILSVGIIGIIRVDNKEDAYKTVDACLEAGLHSLEVTFTVHNAHRIIESLNAEHSELILGAGTILDSETARIAILSGSKYIVSPSFDTSTAMLCNRYAIPYIAGCYTPADMVVAMEYGVDVIKLFPSSGRDPSILKAYTAPLPQANIMPTGGVSLMNAADWIKAGAVALGVGGDLTDGIKTGDFARVTKTAKSYIEIIKQARES